MAPWLPALIAGLFSFGGSALSAGAQDEAQKKSSFANFPDVHPAELLRQATQGTRSMGQALQERAKTPYKLRSSFVQSLPGFAKDPALSDPSLLETRPFDMGEPFGKPVPKADQLEEVIERFRRSRGLGGPV